MKKLIFLESVVRVTLTLLITATFLKKLTFQTEVCDGCHDLMEKAVSSNDVEIVSLKGNDYRIHLLTFLTYRKDEEHLLRNVNLTEKIEYYKLKNKQKSLSKYKNG